MGIGLAREQMSVLLWRSRSWKDFYCVCKHASMTLKEVNLFGYRSLVIDHLNDYLKSNASSLKMGLAYVYCDYRDQIQQSTENIIGAITNQLLRKLPSLPEEIIAIWEKHCRGKEHLEPAQAIEVLCSTCKLFHRTFICLDALDECRDITKLLNCLQQAPSTVRIFGTGREHVLPIVRRQFEHTQTIHIEAKESDIRILIDKKIEEDRESNPSLMNEKLQRYITEKICTSSKGMLVIT